jgi:hypothetical protein
MDGGVEPVTDPDEVRRLRSQAWRVQVEAVVAATLLTGLGVLGAAWRAGA